MGNIDKFLKKLSEKKRKEIEKLVANIINNNLKALDCKKLKGTRDIFRVRKGNIRILFRRIGNRSMVISIEQRGDNTYSF